MSPLAASCHMQQGSNLCIILHAQKKTLECCHFNLGMCWGMLGPVQTIEGVSIISNSLTSSLLDPFGFCCGSSSHLQFYQVIPFCSMHELRLLPMFLAPRCAKRAKVDPWPQFGQVSCAQMDAVGRNLLKHVEIPQ